MNNFTDVNTWILYGDPFGVINLFLTLCVFT